MLVPGVADVGREEGPHLLVRAQPQVLHKIGRRGGSRGANELKVRRITSRDLRGPQRSMAALRFSPHSVSVARRSAGDLPGGAHPVDHRPAGIGPDQEGMHPRRAEAGIIGRNDDIAIPHHVQSRRDAPEIGACRRCALRHHAPGPVSPGKHLARLSRHGLPRRGDDARRLDLTAVPRRRPVGDLPRLHAIRRFDDRIGGNERAGALRGGGHGADHDGKEHGGRGDGASH